MSVKLKDIAERSGVSLQTVGHILGKRAHFFRPETRERVLVAANELGYRRNAAARSMRTGRFDCIAVLQSAGQNVQGTIISGIQDALADQGLRMIVATLPDEKLTSNGFVPNILSELCVDGMLISYDTLIPAAMMELIRKNHIPAVWMNSMQACNCVTLDYKAAGEMAAKELLRRGHRRVGFLNYSGTLHYSGNELLAGFTSALAARRTRTEKFEHCVRRQREVRIADATEWLSNSGSMSAVYTYSEIMAYAVMIAASQMGRKIPSNFSVVSMSNEPPSESGKMVDCTLLDNVAMGRKATQMLLKIMQTPTARIPPELIKPVWIPAGTVTPG